MVALMDRSNGFLVGENQLMVALLERSNGCLVGKEQWLLLVNKESKILFGAFFPKT